MMRFLAMGLLCLSLLFAGCSLGTASDSDSKGKIPSSGGTNISSDSSLEIPDDENSSSGDVEDDENNSGSNDNPFAGGLENGGEFEGH